MKKIIICLVLICMISLVAGQANYNIYYKLNLDYDSEKINISSIDIKFSQEKIENYFGFYTVEVLDYNDEILNLTFFEVPNKILWDGVNPETGEIDSGGTMELEQVSFELFIPYYENAKEIIIYDEDLNEMARKDVGEYSKQRPIEEEEIEDEGEVEKKKKISETKTLTEKLVKYWRIFLIILVALILILIYSLRKKKK